MLFAGRLADYKYYNMDQAVARALGVFEKQVARVRNHETSAEVCARAARAPTFVRGTLVSALVANHNYAHYVGEALVRVRSARLTDTSKSWCAMIVRLTVLVR